MIEKALKLLDSPWGKIIVSCMWGFALALLFHRTCGDGKCVIVRGPRVSETVGKVYDFGKDNGCFQFEPYPVKCEAQTVCSK